MKNNKNFDDISENNINREGLDDYLRVNRPGTLVVIIALAIVFAAVMIWGFTGTLPVTETVTGVVCDPQTLMTEEHQDYKYFDAARPGTKVYCFLDASRYNAEAIKAFNEKVAVMMPDQTMFTGKIESISLVPISKEDAKEILFDNEWVVDQCVKNNYSWFLIIVPDEDIGSYVFTLSQVTFVTEEVVPISFLTKK